MSIGLVLEGGAMRGMYTAGVLDVFLDNNIKIDGIVAVSAGALFGINYLSKQRGRAINYNKKYAKDKRYMGLSSLIKTGNIINKDFSFYELPQKLDVFDANSIEIKKEQKYKFYIEYRRVIEKLLLNFVRRYIGAQDEFIEFVDEYTTDITYYIDECIFSAFDKIVENSDNPKKIWRIDTGIWVAILQDSVDRNLRDMLAEMRGY